jgi:sRNA-binding protein
MTAKIQAQIAKYKILVAAGCRKYIIQLLDAEKLLEEQMRSYKGYKLNEETITFNGKVIEDESLYYYSQQYELEGIVLLDKYGEEFEFDTSHIEGKVSNESLAEYKTRLKTQKAVEKSIANGEWKAATERVATQFVEGNTVEYFHYWKHPVYGETSGAELKLPSQYDAENWLYMKKLAASSAAAIQARFEAWVEHRFFEEEETQPYSYEYALECEKASTKEAKMYLKKYRKHFERDEDARREREYAAKKAAMLENAASSDKAKKAKKSEYEQYKAAQKGKPCKSFEKWLAATPAPIATEISVGDSVKHPKWGDGKVIAVMGSNLSIKFDGVGNKIVDKNAI